MKIKPVKVPKSRILVLKGNWSRAEILQMLENNEEHPRIKLCNEYLSDTHLLPPNSKGGSN